MKLSSFGIRGLFSAAIIVVVVLAAISFAPISIMNVTADELAKAEASMRSEVNYLCLQLESKTKNADAFNQIMSAAGLDPQELEHQDPEGFRSLSNHEGEVLLGYTLAETGTVFIMIDGTIAASDDARLLVGSNARDLLGNEVLDAIDASLQSDQMQAAPYNGVFDEAGGAGSYGDDDDDAYLIARQQDEHIVAIVEPASMVFRNRNATIGRQILAVIFVLVAVGIIVDLLLHFVIARRIDKINDVLGSITSGNLDARVEEKGAREFVSLATDINVTVEALQGWIAEAETRMDSELAAARAIQKSALPSTFPPYPEISQFDIYATMNAAKKVGGDFYDFFLIDGDGADSNKLAFLVADVSDKGVPAALFMMEAKTQIRRELQSGAELSRAVENANKELADGNSAFMFVTMWVGVLDYETGRVEYANVGHNPPLLWQEETGWSWLRDKSGLPLGLFATRSYNAFSFDCGAGGKILLYTDGVTEARSKNNEMYGEERLQAVANAHSGEHPEALVKAVRHDVATFAADAEQFDDITILVLEIAPRTA